MSGLRPRPSSPLRTPIAESALTPTCIGSNAGRASPYMLWATSSTRE